MGLLLAEHVDPARALRRGLAQAADFEARAARTADTAQPALQVRGWLALQALRDPRRGVDRRLAAATAKRPEAGARGERLVQPWPGWPGLETAMECAVRHGRCP